MNDAIPRIRSFHRAVTLRVGALSHRYLGRDRPLVQSRLIFEIGSEGAAVRDLRMRLGLDSGFLSRMLRALESRGLVRTTTLSSDARVRYARLTRAGKAELKRLNELSDDLAHSILAPLREEQRQKLISAMQEVERLLQPSSVVLNVEKPSGEDARWCLEQYYQEINTRFRGGFDPARSPVPPGDFIPPNGYFVIARLSGQPVGCGGLRIKSENVAEIKRMWVSPHTRGLGVGRRMLGEFERIARERGLQAVRLETNEALKEAQSLYRSSGYREIEPYNDEPYAHHWFEKRIK
jgi:DNA-binding MarR family transcriptional regulator/GNAT superfamily N-acetyltransferase